MEALLSRLLNRQIHNKYYSFDAKVYLSHRPLSVETLGIKRSLIITSPNTKLYLITFKSLNILNMKNILFFLIMSSFCYAKCNKDKIDSNGLPPARQEGKNTFGFLLNGQTWMPQGFNGTANLSLYYDQTFSGGVFNLAAYRIINSSTGIRQRITMYGDSIQSLQKIILPNKNRFGLIFRNDVSNCDYDTDDSSVTVVGGYFDIKKLDKTNNIFSGEFEIKLKMNGCEDVQISQGRFDVRY
jgi:hypothetical protein